MTCRLRRWSNGRSGRGSPPGCGGSASRPSAAGRAARIGQDRQVPPGVDVHLRRFAAGPQRGRRTASPPRPRPGRTPPRAPPSWRPRWRGRGRAGTVSRNLAPESWSWKATSSAVYRELIVVATPARRWPWYASAYSGTFGENMPNTSPLQKPLLGSPAPAPRSLRRAARRSASRPLGPSTSAGRSARSSARSSTNTG